jgi:hypothetical protein
MQGHVICPFLPGRAACWFIRRILSAQYFGVEEFYRQGIEKTSVTGVCGSVSFGGRYRCDGFADLGEHVVAFLERTGEESLPICNKLDVPTLGLSKNALFEMID